MNAFDRAMNHLDRAFNFIASTHEYVSRKVRALYMLKQLPTRLAWHLKHENTCSRVLRLMCHV